MNQGQLLIGTPYFSGKLYCFKEFLKSLEIQEYNGQEPFFVFLECDIHSAPYWEYKLSKMRGMINDFKSRTGFNVESFIIAPEMLLNPNTERKKRYINTWSRDILRSMNMEEPYDKCALQLNIDPDVIMPRNGITELLEGIEQGADISTMLIQMHFLTGDTYIIHRQVRYFDFRNFRKFQIEAFKENGVSYIEVDNATSALQLIKKSVFDVVPNFRYIEGLKWGHDVIFSQDARFMGKKIMCSLEAEALHLQPESTFDTMKDMNLIDLWLT
ncbi:MAG: hypothetical protein ACW98X_17865 [Promethearchaeota archaeon]|jgi:hypothetical protein